MRAPGDSQVTVEYPCAGQDQDGAGQTWCKGEGFEAEVEAYRGYLTLLARRGLGRDLAAKVGASDLVQETLLAAGRDIAQYRGAEPADLRRWLEGILRHLLANARRRYRATGKRRVDREASEGRGAFVEDLALSATSPSGHAMRHERERALGEALGTLPEHYRQVIQWHHQERLTFEAIGARLDISPEAARKVWGRSLVRLREALGPGHDPR
jgi:RNA polymerase sigma-70 factor (ECF subfamily)